MFVIWLAASVLAMGMEATGNPRLTALGANQAVSASQSGGNFEGKDVRIGAAAGRAVGGVDDRHVDGGGERPARQLHGRSAAASPCCT